MSQQRSNKKTDKKSVVQSVVSSEVKEKPKVQLPKHESFNKIVSSNVNFSAITRTNVVLEENSVPTVVSVSVSQPVQQTEKTHTDEFQRVSKRRSNDRQNRTRQQVQVQRPRSDTLVVEGFADDVDKGEMNKYFSFYGEMKQFNFVQARLFVSYTTTDDAYAAWKHIRENNQHKLNIRFWYNKEQQQMRVQNFQNGYKQQQKQVTPRRQQQQQPTEEDKQYEREKQQREAKRKLLSFRKTDWFCPKCKTLNFSERTKCLKCSQERIIPREVLDAEKQQANERAARRAAEKAEREEQK